METQIAQKVEGSIASIGNVRNITTYIIEGTVNIFLEFQIGTPIDRAVTDVRDAVAKVRADLPHGIMEPLVQREDVGRRRHLLLRGHHHRRTRRRSSAGSSTTPSPSACWRFRGLRRSRAAAA